MSRTSITSTPLAGVAGAAGVAAASGVRAGGASAGDIRASVWEASDWGSVWDMAWATVSGTVAWGMAATADMAVDGDTDILPTVMGMRMTRTERAMANPVP